ncbi:MAG: SRPBCC domain-containing protein [Geodermatophilaceae bacterium]|nr:SRPBCC domain-containing protein [Geodermatophilaceae bacterium]
MSGIMATAATDVAVTPDRVWTALTEPDQIAACMWGTQVETTWEVGTPIKWNGEHDGKVYQDLGTVLTPCPHSSCAQRRLGGPQA